MAQTRANPPLLLEAFLPYRLNVLAASVSESLERIYSRRFGLDIAGWRVMATLGQFGGVTAKAIGAHSHMHKTKVSRAIAGLEKRGLIRRKANPLDQREQVISLTDQGEAIYREIIPLAQAFQQSLLQALPEAQRRNLDEILMILTGEAERLSP